MGGSFVPCNGASLVVENDMHPHCSHSASPVPGEWGCCHPEEGALFSDLHKGSMWACCIRVNGDWDSLMPSRSLQSQLHGGGAVWDGLCRMTKIWIDAYRKGKGTIIEHLLMPAAPVTVLWTTSCQDHFQALPSLHTYRENKSTCFLSPCIGKKLSTVIV